MITYNEVSRGFTVGYIAPKSPKRMNTGAARRPDRLIESTASYDAVTRKPS